jgi:hypothetical protein
VQNGGLEVPMPKVLLGTTQSIGFYPSSPEKRISIGRNNPNQDVYGNHSRHAGNWIGGPTHEICL